MEKERDLPAGRQGQFTDGGFSEKQMDLNIDKTANNDQVKGSTIFDPQKKKKNKNKSTIDPNI